MQHLIPATEDDHLPPELKTKFEMLKSQLLLLDNGNQYSSNNEKVNVITSQSYNNTTGEAAHIAVSIAKSAQNEIDSLLKGISELEDFLGNDSYEMTNEAFDTYHDVEINNSYDEARCVFEFANEKLGNTAIQHNK